MKVSLPRAFGVSTQHVVQLVALVAAYFGLSAKCVRINDIQITSPVLVGSRVTIKADYDLEGEPFLGIQWMFGAVAFFKLQQTAGGLRPTWFNNSGIIVDVAESDQWKVVIEHVTRANAGDYTCEVSVGKPSYVHDWGTGRLEVHDPPDSGPVIGYAVLGRNMSTSGRVVDVGNRISLNCTARNAYPAATLEWRVNDQPVDENLVRTYQPTDDEGGLKTTVSRLTWIVGNEITYSNLSVKCIAQIHPLYWNSSEQKFYPRYPPIRVSSSRNSGDARSAYSVIGFLQWMLGAVAQAIFSEPVVTKVDRASHLMPSTGTVSSSAQNSCGVNGGLGTKPTLLMKIFSLGFVYWCIGSWIQPFDGYRDARGLGF